MPPKNTRAKKPEILQPVKQEPEEVLSSESEDDTNSTVDTSDVSEVSETESSDEDGADREEAGMDLLTQPAHLRVKRGRDGSRWTVPNGSIAQGKGADKDHKFVVGDGLIIRLEAADEVDRL